MNKYDVTFYFASHNRTYRIHIKDFNEMEQECDEIEHAFNRAIEKRYGKRAYFIRNRGMERIESEGYLSTYGQVVKEGGECLTGTIAITVTKTINNTTERNKC